MALRLGLIQMTVEMNKEENLLKACQLIREAVKKGAKLIALPESFNAPYGTQYFKQYSETIPGPTTRTLSTLAKECRVHILGGTIMENDNEVIFNTCAIFSPNGDMIGKYRKMHLADIDVPGKLRLRESDVLQRGDQFVAFDVGKYKVGVGICYDMRFPELSHIYADMGCHLILYPNVFNTVTGPNQFEYLQRARAIDNQLYVATICTSRDENASYQAWGHSTIIGPWGNVVATTGHNEDIVYADIDVKEVDEVRRSIPLCSQRPLNLYACARSLVS